MQNIFADMALSQQETMARVVQNRCTGCIALLAADWFPGARLLLQNLLRLSRLKPFLCVTVLGTRDGAKYFVTGYAPMQMIPSEAGSKSPTIRRLYTPIGLTRYLWS